MQIRAFLAAEGQRGVHTADTVSGAGVDDMTRAVAQHQERQAVRVCVGASRRALGGIIGQPDLRLRQGCKHRTQLLVLKRLPRAQEKHKT